MLRIILLLTFVLKIHCIGWAQVKKITITPEQIKAATQDSSQLNKVALKTKLNSALNSQKGKANNFFSRFKNRITGYKPGNLDFQGDSIKPPKFVSTPTGKASLIQQVGRREGYYLSEDPVTFTRFTYQGGLNVLGIPFQAGALLTTEQNPDRQQMNRFTVGLDLQKLQALNWRKLQDQIKQLENELKLDKHNNLEELYQFYDKYELDFEKPDVNFAKGQLAAIAKEKSDSLSAIAAEKAETKIAQLKDKLSTKIKSKNDKPGVDFSKIQKLQKIRDSLAVYNQEWLDKYEKYRAMKKAKRGNFGALKKKLKLNTAEKILSNVKTFQIGTTYPQYTPYTLNGIPINGINVELQPGKFYTAFTAFRNLENKPRQGLYKRSIIAGRIGLGTAENDHIHITYLHGKDIHPSALPDTLLTGIQDTVYFQKPAENYLLGAEFRKAVIGSLLSLEGELTHSISSRNANAVGAPVGQMGSYFTQRAFDNKTIVSDRAFNVKLIVSPFKDHRIILKKEHIGTGFYSLGIPFLRNDIALYEIKTEHSLMKGMLRISPAYSRWHDNLSKAKPVTSYMNVYSLMLRHSPKRLPITIVNITNNQIRNLNSVTNFNLVNVTSVYSYKYRKNSLQTMLSTTYQAKKLRAEEINTTEHARSLTLNQNITLEIPVTIQATASYLYSDLNATANTITSFSGSMGYCFQGRWQNTFGLSYAKGTTAGNRQGQFFESKIRFGKCYDFTVRGEHNLLKDLEPNDQLASLPGFNEWFMQTAIGVSF